jgi:hypothetical protein
MSTAAIIIAILAALASAFAAWYSRKQRIKSEDSLRRVKQARKEAGDLARQALEMHERTMDEAPESPELKVSVEHKQDPILRPYKVLLVRMPDGDFDEAHDHGNDLSQVFATTEGALKAVGNADYAIAYWPDGRCRIVKWRDRPTDTLEAETYGG